MYAASCILGVLVSRNSLCQESLVPCCLPRILKFGRPTFPPENLNVTLVRRMREETYILGKVGSVTHHHHHQTLPKCHGLCAAAKLEPLHDTIISPSPFPSLMVVSPSPSAVA